MRQAVILAEAEVKALEAASLQDLRVAWVDRFGPPAPRHRSADLLRRILTWNIQVEAAGGLSKATLKTVRGTGQLKPPGPVLTPGVRLTREWKGRRCDVEVIEGGFLFEDRRYDSLSVIAREITGTRWNGPRFFGQREGAAK
ncbi:MAG TPA: DUF2924 domain-containing protein [Brevundimonas sp.]|uniref:DUF2924 domain-containing protein n=1 Tax=Brevundimonas sp. TaxID=1871086 RepID=UPI002635AD43|nr:DUF2924 domain-containing protein [Brevundimonas sp.]HRO33277.1 DUF2924 domain-containing protein [Brevundimonas sp.]